MKISREKLFQVWGVLNQLSSEKTTAKGAYGIAKNKKLFETEIKSMEEAKKNLKYPEEKLSEFHNKRVELCKEFADKDEAGEPKVSGQTFVISDEGRVAFDKKFATLREEYKETLEEQDKVDAEFRAFLAEEIELVVHNIKIDDMPNGLTAQQLEALGEIIAE